MRATANLEGVLATPFSSRWIFDVEILARLARELGLKGQMYADLLVELPLQEWKEVEGSKVRPRDFIAATLEIAKIYLKYRPYLR